MKSSAAFNAEIETLCVDIEQLEQKLRAKAVAFDWAQQQWNSGYKSKAHSLVEAVLSYMPDGDPRINVEFDHGDLRNLQSGVINGIEAPLIEETASVHFLALVNQLRRLAKDLPSEAST